MKIYSIKNEKLNFFNRPIYCESSAEALSYIQNILMSDADRALSGLKDDLSLYELGNIDFQTGSITSSLEYLANVDEHSAGDYLADCDYIQTSPRYICSLRDIFDTIPEDKLSVSASREDVRNCLSGLSDLSNKFKELFEKVDNLEKSKKKGNKK